jgi:hypothetical protein
VGGKGGREGGRGGYVGLVRTSTAAAVVVSKTKLLVPPLCRRLLVPIVLPLPGAGGAGLSCSAAAAAAAISLLSLLLLPCLPPLASNTPS